MVCFLCFPSSRPSKVSSKGAAGARNEMLLNMADNPNEFRTSLLKAPCADPCACCCTCICSPCGFPACYFRKKVLDAHGNGIEDYVCCQGYVPKIACCDLGNTCRGSALGLCCEGCCCPIFSLGIARIHLMDARALHPDPMDYKIIAFSNCCQILSCFCDILACFFEELRELAAIIDCIADTITATVAGCIGAQINYELKGDGGPPGPQSMVR